MSVHSVVIIIAKVDVAINHNYLCVDVIVIPVFDGFSGFEDIASKKVFLWL